MIFSGPVRVDITEPSKAAGRSRRDEEGGAVVATMEHWNISEKFIALMLIITRMMNLAPEFCDIFGGGGDVGDQKSGDKLCTPLIRGRCATNWNILEK